MSLFYVLLSNPLDSRLRGNDIVVYMIMLVVVLGFGVANNYEKRVGSSMRSKNRLIRVILLAN